MKHPESYVVRCGDHAPPIPNLWQNEWDLVELSMAYGVVLGGAEGVGHR